MHGAAKQISRSTDLTKRKDGPLFLGCAFAQIPPILAAIERRHSIRAVASHNFSLEHMFN